MKSLTTFGNSHRYVINVVNPLIGLINSIKEYWENNFLNKRKKRILHFSRNYLPRFCMKLKRSSRNSLRFSSSSNSYNWKRKKEIQHVINVKDRGPHRGRQWVPSWQSMSNLEHSASLQLLRSCRDKQANTFNLTLWDRSPFRRF